MRRSIIVLIFVVFVTNSLSLNNQLSESSIFKPDGSIPSDTVPSHSQPDTNPPQPSDMNPSDGETPEASAGVSSRRSRSRVRGAAGNSSGDEEGNGSGSGTSNGNGSSDSNGSSGSNGSSRSNGSTNGSSGSNGSTNGSSGSNGSLNININGGGSLSPNGVTNSVSLGHTINQDPIASQNFQKGIGNNIGLGVGGGLVGAAYGVGYPRVFLGHGNYPYGWIGSGMGYNGYCRRVGAYPLIDSRRIYGGSPFLPSRVRFPRRNCRFY
jgi:hypothetical protein